MLLVILVAIGFGVWAISRAASAWRYTSEERLKQDSEHEEAIHHLLDMRQEYARRVIEAHRTIDIVTNEEPVRFDGPQVHTSRCRCCTYWNDINADPYNEYGGLLDGGDYGINSGRRCTCGHASCRGYRAGLYR